MLQREIFLQSEADAWFERNRRALASQDFAAGDPVVATIAEIAGLPGETERDDKLQVLEVGCSEGRRLAWLRDSVGVEVHGVEPSAKAIERACASGLDVRRGTADALPFPDASFDVLVFGFCLYLCDRRDLFRIAQEADRVLKPDAWLVILDFFAPAPIRRDYLHKPGVYSYKMDYRKLFDWHPAYTCYSHKVMHHGQFGYTDDPQEWVATSVLRRRADAGA